MYDMDVIYMCGFHLAAQGQVIEFSIRGPSLYLPESFHLLLVSSSHTYPSSPAVGVVHLLCGHPGLGPAIRGDGESVFPA